MPVSQATRQLWLSADTFTTVLLTDFVDRYGTEAMTWLPETIAIELEEDLGIELPQVSLDKLLTGISLLTTDSFYESLPDFVNWCNILAGDTYDPNLWDPADAAEIAWGVTEAAIIAIPSSDKPFCTEIIAYIQVVLDAEGVNTPPAVLRGCGIKSRPLAADDFADDPAMYAGVYDIAAARDNGLQQSVVTAMSTLLTQLSQLQLQNGSTENIAEKLRKMLND